MPTPAENHQPNSNESDSEQPDANEPDAGATAPTLQQGITEFNQGQFYACHDTLEAIWMDADHAEKPFYQGILQIAVAFYHLGNLNWRGGAILMGEGINRLRKFEPSHQGVNVENLVDQAFDWLTLIQEAGPDQLEAIMAAPPKPFPQIAATNSPTSS